MRILYCILLFIFPFLYAASSSAQSGSASIHIASASGDTVCSGAYIHFTATYSGVSAAHFHWKNNGSIVGSDSAGFTAGPITAGDSIWCDLFDDTASVAAAMSNRILLHLAYLPSISAISGSASFCEGATTMFTNATPSGTWSTSSPSVATINTTGTVTGVSAGSVTISYTLGNSCGTASATTTITVNPLPDAGVISGDSIVCRSTSIPLTETVSGGTWGVVNARGSVIPWASSPSWVTGVYPGRDTVTYAITNSCGTSVATFPIKVVGTTIYLVDYSGPTGCGANDGRILLTNLDRSTGYTLNYTLSGVAHYDSITSDTGGQYEMTHLVPAYYTYISVTKEGCLSNTIADPHVTSTIILADPVINISLLDTLDPTACGAHDGSISFTGLIPGATYDLDYEISGVGHTDSSITGSTYGNYVMSGLYPGFYTYISVTRHGCRSNTLADPHMTSIIQITDPVITISLLGSTNPTTCGANDGTITIGGLIPGASYVLAYELSGVAHYDTIVAAYTGNYTKTGLSAGYYTYISVTRSGCMSNTVADPHVTSPVILTDPAIVISLLGSSNPSYCGAADGTLSISGLIPGAAYTLSYERNSSIVFVSITANSSGNFVLTGLTAGYYSYVYVTRLGCMSNTLLDPSTTTALTLSNPSFPAITGADSVCESASVTLHHSFSGGTWTSGDASVASVTSGSGVVLGIAHGGAYITYSTSSACSTAKYIIVNPLPIAGTLGGAAAVCVAATTSMSTTIGGGSWASSNTGIASVNSGGTIIGIAAGSAAITYSVTNSCGTAVITRSITVNPLPVAATISGASSVCEAATTTLSGSISGGSWTSSNTSVSTVSASGVVGGVAAGTINITYTVTNGCGSASSSRAITVNPLPVAGTLSGTSPICPAGTTSITPSVTGGSWSSGATAIATITSGGTVTGVGAGSAAISYAVTNGCGTAYATWPITILPILHADTISGPGIVNAGATITLSNSVTGGTWSSASSSIATVNSTSGVISGIQPGRVTISYTVANMCSSSTVSKSIAVSSIPSFYSSPTTPIAICGNWVNSTLNPYLKVSQAFSGLTVTWSLDAPARHGTAFASYSTTSTGGILTPAGLYYNPASGYAGMDTFVVKVSNGIDSITKPVYIQVVALPAAPMVSGATNVCAGSSVTLSGTPSGGAWRSNGSSSITYTSAGVVSGVSGGSGIMYYRVTSGACYNESTVSISVSVTGVVTALSGGATNICPGTGFTLTHSVSGGSWTTTDNSIATVSGGTVTAIAPGRDTILYTYSNACNTVTARYGFVVKGPTIPIVCGSSSILCAGSSITYTTTTTGGTWSSTAPAVATVSSGGIVTGVAAGTDTIKYTVVNSCGQVGVGSRIAMVNPLPNAGTISGPASVAAGSTITLTTTGSGGTWSSAFTSLATVGGTSGLVRGVSAGTDTIKYTASNYCGTAIARKVISVTAHRGANEYAAIDAGIRLYPNPSSGIITIDMPGNIETALVIISDISGREIVTKTTTEKTLEVNLSNVPAGIYMVRVNVSGNLYTEKIVVE